MRCAKCRLVFCDRCTPRAVNGDSWCEPCANELIDETKPRWLVGLVVLAVCLGVVWFLVGGAVLDAFGGLRSIRSVRLHIGAMIIPFGIAWGVTFPIFGGERPRIEVRGSARS